MFHELAATPALRRNISIKILSLRNTICPFKMSLFVRLLRFPPTTRFRPVTSVRDCLARDSPKSRLVADRRHFTSFPAQRAQPSSSLPSTPTATDPLQPPKFTESTKSTESAEDPIQLVDDNPSSVDWTKSFHGLSVQPFSKEAADVLLAPIDPGDVEIKPDGIIYLPEIKYRRILNRAFGPGGWGLAPRGETVVTDKAVTREYALLAHGR
jgi:Mitochondrial genome maintenance MGM101